MDNNDIFQEWKTKKFVIVDYEQEFHYRNIVLLTDMKFWSEHMDELVIWCNLNNCAIKGLTVEFRNSEQLTMFALRWA